jgi:ribosomal protein L14E/L6E/L27E
MTVENTVIKRKHLVIMDNKSEQNKGKSSEKMKIESNS